MYPDKQSIAASKDDFLSMAVCGGMRLYVLERLREPKKITTSYEVIALLDWALRIPQTQHH